MKNDSLELIAERIVGLGLATPAIFFLEMHKPLAGLVHGTAVAFDPLLGAIMGNVRKDALLKASESRESIEELIVLIGAKANAAKIEDKK